LFSIASASGLAQSKTCRLRPIFFCFLSLCFRAWGDYSLNWSTFDGGGGTSTGGVYAVSGTIGQPDAGGPLTNGQYSVTGGFRALPEAVQVEGAPTLQITRATPGLAKISWTPATSGWVLQENLNLATTNWANSLSGATNPVVVPATVPGKFFRLRKP
jgi:hypothetical protein